MSQSQEDAQRELHREMLQQLQAQQQQAHNKALAMQFMQQMMSSTDAQQSWNKYEVWIQEQARLARTARLKRGVAREETVEHDDLSTRRFVSVKRKKI